MGLSSAMEIGRSALNVFRVASEVSGENVANVNTPGYSRQRVILENAPPSTANGFSIGTGVSIATVERYYDSLLQKQLVNANTTQNYDTTKSNVLQQIEPIFNEVANDGLGAAMTNFFGSWQDLTLNPAGSMERQAVLTRAQTLVDNFHSTSTALSDARTTQNDALVPIVDDINNKLTNIAQLNGQIKNTELVSGNANEMRDQRDLLIRELSKQIGLTFTENSDGTTDVTYKDNGAALVTGTQYGSFSLTGAPAFYTVNVTPVGGVAAAVTPTTGALGATVTLRDTTIPAYQVKIDALASQMVTSVNAIHTTGRTLADSTGVNFFNPAGTTAATISVSVASTNLIAASTSASPVVTGDGSNALLIAQLQSTKTMSAGTATFNSYFASTASSVGLDVQASKTTVAQDEAFTKQLEALRESQSGVSLDEELTNLIKYQRSYQAAAKLISTASDMMDTVINMLR